LFASVLHRKTLLNELQLDRKMELSDALSRIKPSPTVAMSALATQLKHEGRDIISLSAGNLILTPLITSKSGNRRDPRGPNKYTDPDGMLS